MKIPKRTLRELDLPEAALEDHIIGTGRWSVHHEIIFEYHGRFYQATYSIGATEYQEERPWEYEDEIECTEVKKVPVTVMQWVPVNG